jgi:hypothetical protein
MILWLIDVSAATIELLRKSECSGAPGAEASTRLIIELLIRDCLDHLNDGGAIKQIKLWPEASLCFHNDRCIVSGTTDWVIPSEELGLLYCCVGPD